MKPFAREQIGNQFVNKNYISNQSKIQNGNKLTNFLFMRVLMFPKHQKARFNARFFGCIVKTSLPFLSVLILLTGCSTTSEVFECEAGKGIGCKSISEVNKMVDTGKLANNEEPDFLNTVAPVFEKNTRRAEAREVGLNEVALSDQTLVNRVREEHLRVWIAPFQDEQGSLHEGSVVHTVIRPGYWQLTPTIEGVNHAE